MNVVTEAVKAVGETLPLVINFSDALQAGETITGAGTTVTVFSGTDASPSSLLSGAATYDAYGNVTQNVTAGIVGVIYNVAITVTASGSHNYVKLARLAVISNDASY